MIRVGPNGANVKDSKHDGRRGKNQMRSIIKVWMAAVVVVAMSLLAAAGTASAATSGVQPRFAAEARAAHISVAKARQLQEEVTNYIHEHGGTQVALNVVDVPGGSITFVVPGEKYARDLATTTEAPAVEECPTGSFCAYEDTLYTGNERSYFDNCEKNSMPWAGEGSYKNILPDNDYAIWYGSSGAVVYKTPDADSENPDVNWAPVASIMAACLQSRGSGSRSPPSPLSLFVRGNRPASAWA